MRNKPAHLFAGRPSAAESTDSPPDEVQVTTAEPDEASLPWTDERPQNYFRDCVGRPRPCPWVGCQHHLLVDVNPATGALMVNAGRTTESRTSAAGRQRAREVTRRVGIVSVRALKKKRPRSKWGEQTMQASDRAEEALFTALESAVWTGAPTCALDVAESGGATLEAIGDAISLCRERVRQVEVKALRKMQTEGGDELLAAAESRPDDQSNYGPDAWERAGF